MIADALASLVPSGRSVTRYVNATLENPQFSLNDPSAYEYLAGGSRSASGVAVTYQKALCLSAVWQAVSLISGDAAKLPLYPIKRLPEDDREIDSKHKAYFPVAIRANPETSAFQFWRTMYVHATLWNNGYGYISQGTKGIELYNLLPDRTAPEWVKYADATGAQRSVLVYLTEADGQLKTIMPSQVLHVRGLSIDGCAGYDMLKAARDLWGLALAAQNFESKFFKNGARKGGILELPVMSKPARDTAEEGFRKSYEEGDNPFKTVILREGAKFHDGQVNPREAQLVEQDDRGKRDVASYFNIPPSKLGIRDSVSYNSFEQDNLSYLHGCLHHWTCTASDECDMKLLSEDELRSDTHYFEHNYSEFIQADWKTLNEGLEIQRRNEVINANDWRRKLNMRKRTDPEAESYVNPNTKPAPAAGGGEPEPKDEPKPAKPDKKAVDAHRALFSDTFGRVARRVAFDARKAAGDSKKFTTWIESEAANHKGVFRDAVRPVANAYTSVFGGDDVAITAQAESLFFVDVMVLAEFLDAPHAAVDLVKNVETYLTTFERHTPDKVAAKIMETANV